MRFNIRGRLRRLLRLADERPLDDGAHLPEMSACCVDMRYPDVDPAEPSDDPDADSDEELIKRGFSREEIAWKHACQSEAIWRVLNPVEAREVSYL